MNTTNALQAQDDLFASLGLKRAEQTRKASDPSELGMQTFLKLMVTQMNNQDPFKPMENGDFLAQIAQFGSVTGLDKLNNQIQDLSASLTSGQALQAGGLVGRNVLVPVEVGQLAAGGTIEGQVELPSNSSEVTLRVYDQAGQLVREMPLGPAGAGSVRFQWDGLDDTGAYMPPGRYRMQLSAVQGDQTIDLQTQLFSRVESVNLSARDGLTLNLQGLGPVAFSNVKQIY
ncbi:MAG: flagellar hook assembly protein FlgD [Gammaproteobacteria bacterium]|nr:MAG: flagellar hook assembly protein FlgD [Gammaproteobacteria bacterium]